MTFVAPAALAFAAVAVPILALYMLRTRRARTRVPSTMLWALAHRPVTANVPWQPLRLSVLLLLQLLALALFVLALAGPARRTAVPLADHTVLIVDTSASMQATTDGRMRLDEARGAAAAAVDRLGSGQRMSVIEAGPRARVVVSGSGDRGALADAVRSLQATDGRADIAGAFALAASLETAAEATIVHLYSDGALDREALASAPPGLVHVPSGASEGNLGIERVSVARAGPAWEAFVRVVNTGGTAADAAVLLLGDDGQVARVPVRVQPRAAADLRAPLPSLPGGRVVARLAGVRGSAGGPRTIDALAADDAGRAVQEASVGLRIVLMTPGNVFLESFLRTIPGAEVSVSARAAPTRGHTLAVYDRIEPPASLDVPAIVIAPPGGAPGVRPSGLLEEPIATFAAPREEILHHVDVSTLAVRRAQRIDAPRLRTLIGAGDDPLLAIGVPGGTPLAYFAFDLRESNLPVQVAFPVLFGNLVSFLTRGDTAETGILVAGDPLPIRVPGGATRLEVMTPDGETLERTTTRAIFDDTALAGFYSVRALNGPEVLSVETFAVNVPPEEADLTVRRVRAPARSGPQADRVLGGLATIGPGLLVVALAVLLVEWWWAHGRPTPGRRYRRSGEAS